LYYVFQAPLCLWDFFQLTPKIPSIFLTNFWYQGLLGDQLHIFCSSINNYS
jgi:hypothetical protein